MPECYEVKRISEYLVDSKLINQRLEQITFKNKGERIVDNLTIEHLKDLLEKQLLLAIKVKAKYTGFEFSSGTVVLHYRFTGIPHVQTKSYGNQLYSIYSLPITNKKSQHCRFKWQFESKTIEYYDTRCLSKLYFYPNFTFEQTPQYQALAPDIRELLFLEYKEFKEKYGKSSIIIKQWLLNQNIAPSGIGNYLACEILAYAKIYPFLQLKKINRTTYQQLINAFKEVHHLAESTPEYHWFRVFNRQKCKECDVPVIKKKYSKNVQTTHFCPQCQQKGR